MLATLGPIVFEASDQRLRTFRDAKRSTEARFAEHEVHLAPAKSEFLAPGLDDFSFSIRLDISRGVIPRDELRQMRALCKSGDVCELVIGGELAGDFTIRRVSEDLTRFDARGVLTTADVTLTLREYL